MHSGIDFDTTQVFIGSAWRAGESGQTLPLHNPSDGTLLAHIARGNAADVDAAVLAAQVALDGPWGELSATERGRVLMKMSAAVLTQVDELARLEALDVGKPLKQSRADAVALARYLEFYGGAADKVLGETIPFVNGYTAFTLREPHGVTAHIVPWNYPMQIIGRSVGAALAMGNACALKPAEEPCLTALAFARIAQQAGLPAGALNVVTGLGEEAGAALSAHPGVRHVSFTGSVAVGALIQAAAAKNAVPVTLELGRKSPQIVFDDADLDAALPFLVNAGIQNAGQTCSAASRILVQRGVFDTVVQRMADRYRALRVGPALTDPDVRPLISARQQELVLGYLALAHGDGLQIAAQAPLPADLPRVGVMSRPHSRPHSWPGWRRRTALRKRKSSGRCRWSFLLRPKPRRLLLPTVPTSALWPACGHATAAALRLARKLQCGQVFINNYGAGGGIELPFGGVKHSGHGREKGFEALYGFSTLKTVAIKHA